MKFFTLEAYNYDDDDQASVEAWCQSCDSYEGHLARIKGILPDSLLEISGQDVFDDGLITRVRYYREKQRLELLM